MTRRFGALCLSQAEVLNQKQYTGPRPLCGGERVLVKEIAAFTSHRLFGS